MRWLVLVAYLTQAYAQYGGKFDCPNPWMEFGESCYKFELFPDSLASARAACDVDGAGLLSVTSRDEHQFIVSWLEANDLQRKEWYTSGHARVKEDEGSDSWQWEGAGERIEGYQFWINDAARKQEGRLLLYAWGDSISSYGWAVGREKLGDKDIMRPYICQISKAEIYKIIDGDRGFEFGNSEVDALMLHRGPHFIEQPEDVIFDTNGITEYAVMECEAHANPPPEYQWYITKEQQARLIDPMQIVRYTVTNGKLVIHQPKDTEDNGDYHCVAGNEYGSILSNTVQLSFGYLLDFPKSTRDPLRVPAYEEAGIECNPPDHGYATIRFAWYKDSPVNYIRPKLKPYTFISHTGKLYFSHVTKDDNGFYSCVVSSPFSSGKVSEPIRLQVLEAVASTRDPKIASGFPTVFPTSPKQGDNLRIECFAYGTDELFYRWERLGDDMPNTASMSDHNRVLNIPNVQLRHSGRYRCTVQRENGLSTSGIVQVHIEAAPFFTIPLKHQHVDQGSELTWRCIAEGDPTPSFTWYRNASRLTVDALPAVDQPRYTISENVLSISKVDPVRDSGMYQCAATNSHGRRYSSAQLRVLSFAPSFAKSPLLTRQYGTLRGNVTLLCHPEAAPPAEKEWYKDGRPLASDGRRSILQNGNLRIVGLRDSDNGEYTCKATNTLGTAESTGTLTILSSTTLSQTPRDDTVKVNESVRMSCDVSINPVLDVAYDWYHNNYKIEFIRVKTIGQDQIYIEREEKFKRGTGIDRGGLIITNAGFEHAGTYTCVAKTTGRTLSAKADLKVVGPPSQPSGVYGEATSASSIILKWGKAHDNGSPIVAYSADKMDLATEEWELARTDITGKAREERRVKVTGLKPYTSYRFRVRAENAEGESDPSDPSPIYTTLAARPVTAPENVGGGGGKVGVLTIHWDPVPRSDRNGETYGYHIWYKRADSEEDAWVKKTREQSELDHFTVLLGDAYYYQLYDVRVQGFNEMGDGPMSEVVQVHSSEGIPSGVATNIRASQWNATALYVEWDPVEDTLDNMKGVLKGYRINYWNARMETEEMSIYRVVMGQRDGGMIIGLNYFTEYIINVQVINTAGNGPKSQDFQQETLRAPPLYAPTEVAVDVVGRTSIKARWRGVSTGIDEEPLEGYMVRIWRVGENLYVAEDYEARKKSELVIEELAEDTMYNLRIYGYSRGGQGLMSSPGLQFVLGRRCRVNEEMPDKDYVYKCLGETDSAVHHLPSLLLLTSLSALVFLLNSRH